MLVMVLQSNRGLATGVAIGAALASLAVKTTTEAPMLTSVIARNVILIESPFTGVEVHSAPYCFSSPDFRASRSSSLGHWPWTIAGSGKSSDIPSFSTEVVADHS